MSVIAASSRFTAPEHVLSRNVGDEAVLLQLELETYFGLDPVGRRSWELLCGGHSVADAAVELAKEYQVLAPQAEADLLVFAGQLLHAGLLVHSA